VPGQRRLAISRLRVPNLDGSVGTAAGNLCSIGTPRHRRDPEIVRSQDTNQQKQRGKNLGEKNLEKTKRTRLSARSASTGNLQIASPKSWWSCHRYRWQFAFHRGSMPPSWHCICEKSVHESTENRRKNLGEKLTLASARSASIGNLQIASPKSWWFRPYCRWQFVFHRDSTPQSRHWNCKKSGQQLTATERGKLGGKEFGKNKTYESECPVPSTPKYYIFKSSKFVSMFEHAYPKKSHLFEWPVSLEEVREAKD